MLQSQLNSIQVSDIFSPASTIHGHSVMKLLTVANEKPDSHDTCDIFKVMSSNIKVTDDIFKKMHFFSREI